MFRIEIKTGGAAFCDKRTGEPDALAMENELLRIIKRVEWNLATGVTNANLIDINGNTVGRMEVIE